MDYAESKTAFAHALELFLWTISAASHAQQQVQWQKLSVLVTEEALKSEDDVSIVGYVATAWKIALYYWMLVTRIGSISPPRGPLRVVNLHWYESLLYVRQSLRYWSKKRDDGRNLPFNR